MDILERYSVPTGDILITQGQHGLLECLSLGDYGKDVNLKSDALGLSREIERVEHTELLPLSKKWVITVSSQYGCSMGCEFCDVPKVGPGRNATMTDMLSQVSAALSLHPEIRGSERLNIHFARMGEPTWNLDVISATMKLVLRLSPRFTVHPVVSTMLPYRNRKLMAFLDLWMDIKNNALLGNAGLQLSINSTDEDERQKMFDHNALTLHEASEMMKYLPAPRGRKITLNFAVAGYQIDALHLRELFDPERFIVKLTPMHKTATAAENSVETAGDYTTFYPYKEHEENLKAAGFEVLVFIASREEDESRITCGNAILARKRG